MILYITVNGISRKAIERLGVKQDGILRNHKIIRNGRIRDTVCYSIIKSEWPTVKENLLQRIIYYDNNYEMHKISIYFPNIKECYSSY